MIVPLIVEKLVQIYKNSDSNIQNQIWVSVYFEDDGRYWFSQETVSGCQWEADWGELPHKEQLNFLNCCLKIFNLTEEEKNSIKELKENLLL